MSTASPLEVARDIVVALISRSTSQIGVGPAIQTAEEVAKVFEVIHKKVAERYHAE